MNQIPSEMLSVLIESIGCSPTTWPATTASAFARTFLTGWDAHEQATAGPAIETRAGAAIASASSGRRSLDIDYSTVTDLARFRG